MWLFRSPSLLFHLPLLLTLIFLPLECFSQNNNGSNHHVKFLPGFDGPLPFYLETGYVGVGKSEEVQLFYYFVKSESDPEKDPVLLWLTGGPCCSSFSGLAYELGPLAFSQKEFNGSLPILVSNPYPWTKFASIIFLDQPVDTGFSYATTPTAAYDTDLQACNYVYEFLQKWLVDHAEFNSNPLYVAGDSYSGITIPVIVQLISDGIEAGNEPLINLKGYSLGNPKTFSEEINYQVPFALGHGLISTEFYESITENCKVGITNELCLKESNMFGELVGGLNDQHILEPACGSDDKPLISGKRRSLGDDFVQDDYKFCRATIHDLSNHWANDPSVQEALHIRKGTMKRSWARCRKAIQDDTYIITFMNSIPYHVNLSSKGYRSIIYSGDHDMGVPFQSTQAWIKNLNYSIVDDWRPWIVNSQVAGYTRSFSNHMTFATVKGGGHVAPEYKPEECFHLLNRWLTYQPL